MGSSKDSNSAGNTGNRARRLERHLERRDSDFLVPFAQLTADEQQTVKLERWWGKRA